MGLRNKLLSVKPQQWGGQQIEDPEALDQIIAFPGEPDATDATFMPEEAPALPEVAEEEQLPPSEEESTAVESEPTEAFQTDMPEPEEVSGKDIEAQFQQDEAEQLMSQYRKTKEDVQSEQATLETSRSESERSRQTENAIAGALQSFGEGLAAITGGSAKPLQTGAETLRRSGQMQAAEEERKARGLRERLQQAKTPIEEKTAEMELRARLGKGKLEQNLADPKSDQSVQARQNAANFIDNMIAQGQANQADTAVLERLEQSKAILQNMSASQIKDFYNTLKPISVETSREAQNEYEMQKLKAQENMRTRMSEAKDEKDQQKIALKDFMKVRTKIAEEENSAAKIGPQMTQFQEDIDKAIAGDKDAAKRVVQNYGVINYLNARSYESKGVFTDNDLKALSQLDAGRTWAQQFNDWYQRGMTGILPRQALIRVKGVIDENVDKFTNPGQFIRNNYAQIFEDTGSPAHQKYAEVLRKGGSKPAEPQSTGAKVFNSQDDVVKAISDGTVTEGQLVKIGETTYKYSNGGLDPQ